MTPLGKASLLGNILENDGACLDRTASGDGAVRGIKDRLEDAAGGHSARSALLRLSGLGPSARREQGKEDQEARKKRAGKQGWSPPGGSVLYDILAMIP
jgi:hypothetical protein